MSQKAAVTSRGRPTRARCGLLGAIVVSRPWPGSTSVSPGSVKSRRSIDSMICSKLAPSNFVLPGAAGEQRVAAEQHRVAVEQEARRAARVAGRVDRAQPEIADLDHVVVGDREVVGGSIAASSARRRRRCRRRGSASTAWMWSKWPWVVSTRRTPVARETSSSSSCSLAASRAPLRPWPCTAGRTRCCRTVPRRSCRCGHRWLRSGRDEPSSGRVSGRDRRTVASQALDTGGRCVTGVTGVSDESRRGLRERGDPRLHRGRRRLPGLLKELEQLRPTADALLTGGRSASRRCSSSGDTRHPRQRRRRARPGGAVTTSGPARSGCRATSGSTRRRWRACRLHGGDWIVTMDEDGQHDPAYIRHLLDAAYRDRSAAGVARRPTRRRTASCATPPRGRRSGCSCTRSRRPAGRKAFNSYPPHAR